MSAQAVKDVAEVSEVLLKGTTVDQDIVEVDENVLLQDVPEDVVHRPLEGSGCVVDAETKSLICFASIEDGCTPWGVAGFNETQSQEFLKLTLEFGGLGDRESVGCLVVNTIVRHKLDGVLDVAHRWDAGVRERRWENVVVHSRMRSRTADSRSAVYRASSSASASARDGGVDSTDGGGTEVEMGAMKIEGGSGSRGMSSASGLWNIV
ncbi:hypothetical protein CBR_g23236 [Chara braunii]|uniref:Uncharacterized protein n=1 Tax=Chara braunii TaxID=69332 RepID=A0A388JV97_CHABU|nr:hypothetical protein CBR_g23236 [Chara braunii]|eukprot:GBG61721.1 hypothetical protein CBR_g23236 [Chara braunii]